MSTVTVAESGTGEPDIDWAQFGDLQEACGPALVRLWRDAWKDTQTELGGLADREAVIPADEVRRTLHRVRGLVSMWGLRGLANDLRAWEKSPAAEEPATGRALRAEAALELAARCCRLLEERMEAVAG